MANVLLATLGCLLVAGGLGCMVAGRRAIRRGRTQRHRHLMIAAFTAHAAFVPVFVCRFVLFGFADFDGPPAMQPVYLVVFYSHEPLAVASVPFVLVTLTLGLTRNFRQHRQIAGMAYWVWLYASVTGVLLYGLLYLS